MGIQDPVTQTILVDRVIQVHYARIPTKTGIMEIQDLEIQKDRTVEIVLVM